MSRHTEKKTFLDDSTLSVDTARLKISVCMAVYNGERYIVEQMDSVLCQLEDKDEVVVVDDGSKDRTLEIVASYGDSRIRVFRHEKNQGVIASFEDAVRKATGDVLFFCDQDDIWTADRVQKMSRVFAENPDVSIVVSNITLIDENGGPIQEAKRLVLHPFDARFFPNLISNRFQGSAMAIRSDLRREILPFPKKVTFVHDAWIGARSALEGRKTIYLDEPLLYFRRHTTNDSGRLSLSRQMRKRLELLASLAIFPLRRESR